MQKTSLKRFIIGSVGLFIILISLVIPESGLRAKAQTASGGFSIRAIIPDNQVDTRQTYFDLRMKPGDEQTIQVVITNSRTEELVAEVSLNAASTARDGLIVYTEPNVRDDIMTVAITDVASLQAQTVTVPPNDSRTIDIQIKMPAEPFDGVILGGIAVTDGAAGKENQAATGISINNTITYVVALKLTQTDTEDAPDFDLTAITPTLINHRTAVAATLLNKSARIVNGMEVKAQVYRKGSDAILHELTLEKAEMAPLSKGDFVIDWDGEALRPGTYRLMMTAGYEGERWEWDEDFTIAGEADELNKGAVGLEKDYTWLYLALGIAILVLVGILAYRMGKRKKNEK